MKRSSAARTLKSAAAEGSADRSGAGVGSETVIGRGCWNIRFVLSRLNKMNLTNGLTESVRWRLELTSGAVTESAGWRLELTSGAMRSSGRRADSRFLLLLLGLAMLVFALLQLNDPDPLIWVTYYAAIAVACTVAAYRPLPVAAFVALAALTVAGAVVTLPGFVDWVLSRPVSDLWAPMSADRSHIEDSRELLGLLIAGGFLAAAYRLSRR